MSRQYQDPNYHHQTPYQNPSQHPGQYLQPLPNAHHAYDDRSSQQAYPHYSEDSLQPQPGQRHVSRSPHAGPLPFPQPQQSGASGHPPAYIPPSQTMSNLTVPVGTHHQHERRSSQGHSPAMSSSQQLYPAVPGSDTGSGSSYYPPQTGVQPHHGGYPVTAAQSQGWNAAVYDEGRDSRSKAPPNHPASASRSSCRYPRCGNNVFFDRRVNELREWCSDQHMQEAVMNRVEKPCNSCRAWPRRNGYKLCSGNACRYPY